MIGDVSGSHPAVDRRDRVAVGQGLTGVAHVEVRLEVVLPEPLRDDLVRLLLHEVAQSQVSVRARLVLHALGVVVARLGRRPEANVINTF